MGALKKVRVDKTGQQFGMFKVEALHSFNRYNRAMWKCRCVSCGAVRIKDTGNLHNNPFRKPLRCLCDARKAISKNKTTHGLGKSPLYMVWFNMKERCHNPTCKAYRDYGGRGILVCEEWQSLEVFAAWAQANGYDPKLQLDRIDNNDGYHPANCRFVTKTENLNNTRSNTFLTAFGETKTVAQWVRDPRCRVKYNTLSMRVRHYGWTDIEQALTKTPR